MVIKINEDEFQVYLSWYDLSNHQLYNYGRKSFGFMFSSVRYEINADNMTLTLKF